MKSKKTISQILATIFVLALLLSAYFYKDFWKKQINKGISYYWVWQGDKFYKKRKIHKAIEQYQKAVSYNPEHYRALYNLGNIFVMYEDYFSALEEYEKALNVRPNYQTARINYALLLANATYNYDKAIEEYEKALSIKPSKMSYLQFGGSRKIFNLNKGIAYYNLGLAWRGKSHLVGENNKNYSKYLANAQKSYENATKYLDSYNIFYNLALTNHILGSKEEAGYYYCRAIQEAPLDYEAHYNLAMLLKSMKRNKDSFVEFKKAGQILDIKGDTTKTRYIYDLLNETMHKIILEDDYKYLIEHIEEENKTLRNETTYTNGKIVVADDLDKEMIKNFKQCVFLNKTDEDEK